MTKYINSILFLFFGLFLCVCFSLTNYNLLVDPVYYINATLRSDTVINSLYYGESWRPDYAFILLSFGINKLSSNYNTIGALYSSVILFLLLYSTIRFIKNKSYILLLLLLVVNFSFIGIEFNIWRQGIAICLIICAVYNPKKDILFVIFASLFHFNTGFIFFFYLIFRRITFAMIKKYIAVYAVLLLCFIKLVSIFMVSFQSNIDVYSQDNYSAPYMRYFFALFTFIIIIVICSSSFKAIYMNIYSTSIMIFILSVGLFFLLIMPSASERFMHYYFMIFPFFIFESLGYCKKQRKSIVFIFILFYLSANLYLISESSIFDLINVTLFL